MDKKILLSVLIVALIGIVAATYQINPGQDILNPLASVETEDTPITDVLTAPETQDDAKAQQAKDEANAKAKADAQAQQAKDEANAKAKAESDAQAQQNAENQANAGSTQKSASTIGSGDTIVVQGSDNNGESNSGSNNGESNNGGNNNGESNNGGNNNGGSNGDSSNTQPTSTTTDNTPQQTDSNSNQITDQIKSTIQSIIQGKIDSEKLTLDMDNCQLEGEYYKIPAYYKNTREFAGTFYVNINNHNWHFIDKNGNYQTEETPTPGAEGNGQLVTDE